MKLRSYICILLGVVVSAALIGQDRDTVPFSEVRDALKVLAGFTAISVAQKVVHHLLIGLCDPHYFPTLREAEEARNMIKRGEWTAAEVQSRSVPWCPGLLTYITNRGICCSIAWALHGDQLVRTTQKAVIGGLLTTSSLLTWIPARLLMHSSAIPPHELLATLLKYTIYSQILLSAGGLAFLAYGQGNLYYSGITLEGFVGPVVMPLATLMTCVSIIRDRTKHKNIVSTREVDRYVHVKNKRGV